MSPNFFIVFSYLVVSGGSRIRGIFRRWQQPLVRGPEWFFNVPVQPDFYSGAGKKILDRYRMRMLMPVAIEVVVAAAIFLSGHFLNLAWLIAAMALFIHVNHVYNVDSAERQARPFSLPETEQPAPSVVLSLKPRRLRDYSNRRLERAMTLVTIGVIAWLVRYYLSAPEHHNLRQVFGEPALLLYFQIGLLFVKYVVVAWRTPVPQFQADEYLKAREETRKFYLKVCDILRVMNALILLLWPALLTASPGALGLFVKVWLPMVVVASIVLGVWQEIRRKQVLALALRAKPTKLPDFAEQATPPSWPLCYQPSLPMLVLKGARGYSLNLANTLAQLGAAYLAGLAVLMVVLTRTVH